MSGLFRASQSLQWRALSFPRDLSLDDVGEFVLAVATNPQLDRVVVEVSVESGQAQFRIGAGNRHQLDRLLKASLRGVHPQEAPARTATFEQAWEARVSSSRRMLAVDDPAGFTARLLGALQALGSSAIYQVVIGQRLRPQVVPDDLSAFEAQGWAGQLVEAAWSGKKTVPGDARRALAAKQATAGARATLRFGMNHDPTAKASLMAVLRSLESPGVRFDLVRCDPLVLVRGDEARRSAPLNRHELTCLLGWPVGDRGYPGVLRGGSVQLAVSAPAAASRIIGVGTHPASCQPVGISEQDARRHTHVLGPTGVGKSTLLLNLILQDIADGRAVVVIEPTGDLVDDVLARVSPADLDRLVVLDPARSDKVVGFNPLAVAPNERELAVDGVLNSFAQLHFDSWGPRTQDVLHNSLLTLIGTSWASICFVPRLLAEADFRRQLLSGADLPPTLASFWVWFDALSAGERASVIAPLMNKLRPLTLRSSVRGMLGQVDPDFDPRSIFTQRKVLLVPLRKGQIGPIAANLIGSLVIARIWQLALQRTTVSTDRRHLVPLVLDEFQDFVALPADFADVLAQARALGLGLTLAHQHLAQLRPDMRSAVLANAQNRIMFRTSHDDAATLSRGLTGIEATDLSGADQFCAYAHLLHEGQLQPPASIRTMAPPAATRSARETAEQLARRDGRSLTEIDAHVFATSTADNPEQKPGRKKRANQ